MESIMVSNTFQRMMTASFWKQHLSGNENLVIVCDNNSFICTKYTLMDDDSIVMSLDEKNFNIANEMFKINELWDANGKPGFASLRDFEKNCKLITNNQEFNIYQAYMIYPDKCDRFIVTFRPTYMSLIKK